MAANLPRLKEYGAPWGAEVDICGGLVEEPLVIGDEVRVVALGHLDGFMAEQLLDRAQRSAAGEERDRERVAEAVGPGGDAGDLAEAGDGERDGVAESRPGAAATPKIVIGMDCAYAVQSFDGVGREFDADGHAGLLGAAQEQVAGGGVEGFAAELAQIGDAQSGVEQGEDDGAGAPADVWRLSGVARGKQVARTDEGLHFVRLVWLGGERLHAGHAKELGRVLLDVSMGEAPGEKSAEIADLLLLGGGLERMLGFVVRDAPTGGTELLEDGGVDRGERRGGRDSIAQVIEEGVVDLQSSGSQRSGFEVARVGVEGLVECEGRGGVGGGIEVFDAALGAGPVSGLERLADRAAVGQLAVDPDGAVAEGVVGALSTVVAGFGVSAVRRHGRHCTRICTRISLGLQMVDSKVCYVAEDSGSRTPRLFSHSVSYGNFVDQQDWSDSKSLDLYTCTSCTRVHERRAA